MVYWCHLLFVASQAITSKEDTELFIEKVIAHHPKVKFTAEVMFLCSEFEFFATGFFL